jgi:hypothetical protein
MRPYGTPEGTRAIVTSLAAVAVFSGPAFSIVASAAQNVEKGGAINVIQPESTNLGYALPPLSDHILLAQANEDQIAVPQNNRQSGDDTAKQYDRGYYTEPVQITQLVPVPTTLEQTEAVNVSNDETAQQFDRGYYREPEMTLALVILPSEGATAGVVE